ncbi:MAG: hypothetical protein JWQ94_4130 [Tardiphaga sp.]|nr:hypothetical protein [Tardiphaga sp.]
MGINPLKFVDGRDKPGHDVERPVCQTTVAARSKDFPIRLPEIP